MLLQNILKYCREIERISCDIDCADSLELKSILLDALEKRVLSLLKYVKQERLPFSMLSSNDILLPGISCKAEHNHDLYSFKFNQLLPFREHYEYNRTFADALSKAIRCIGYKKYDERMAVVVIHHYQKPSEIKDYDNLESKMVVDVVKRYYLYDDNPSYVSLHFDFVLDDSSYTEIQLTTESQFYKKREA